MITKPNKVFVGKDISRTSALTSSTLYTGTNGPAEGEVIVLDKDKKLLSAGSTVADTDTIYIAVATADTYSVTNTAGTTVTGIRKLILSDPIQGKNVNSYTGLAYSAAVEGVATVGTGLTPVVGTEYVLRIVYKDLNEHPGQFTHTYRVFSSSATLQTLYDQFRTKINAHKGSRVAATGTTTLILTGKVVDNNATSEEIDDYKQVNFSVFLTSNNFGTSTVTATTAAFPGTGTAKLVRDAEKAALGYKGVTNRIHFPVKKPAITTDMTKTYDTVTIVSDVEYQSPDNQYVKKTGIVTQIFVPVAAGQMDAVLGVLNTWMASTPKAFNPISL